MLLNCASTSAAPRASFPVNWAWLTATPMRKSPLNASLSVGCEYVPVLPEVQLVTKPVIKRPINRGQIIDPIQYAFMVLRVVGFGLWVQVWSGSSRSATRHQAGHQETNQQGPNYRSNTICFHGASSSGVWAVYLRALRQSDSSRPPAGSSTCRLRPFGPPRSTHQMPAWAATSGQTITDDFAGPGSARSRRRSRPKKSRD